ncbi:MAG: hypothetical protein RLZZ350_2301 [Verrucomicrobiota bacterium]|jgi:2,3-bisphosphoglycerate-independent phosphoglycerate mutase
MKSSCLKLDDNGKCSTVDIPPNATLRQLIAIYEKKCRPVLKGKLAAYGDLSFDEAVEKSACGLEIVRQEKRINHLRRITKKALARGCKVLLSHQQKLKGCKKFDEIYQIVSAVVSATAGLGEMYAYDVALRIGASQQIFPDKVYLQRGTRKGAEALGLDAKVQTIELADFPAELRRLKPCEIEDFLCIFKDHLNSKKSSHLKPCA